MTPPAADAQRSQLRRLSTLIQAAETICSTLDLPEVLDRILHFVTRELTAERSTLYRVEPETGELVSLIAQGLKENDSIRLSPGQGIAGHVAASGEIVALHDAYQDSRFNPQVDEHTGFRTSSMLVIPLASRDRMVGVLQVLNRRAGVFDGTDRDYLRALGSLLAVAIENARLHQEEVARQRLEVERRHMEQELRTARAIQERFLPGADPHVPGLDVAGTNVASEHVSGDYYDYLPLGEGRLGLVVADVSGHGIPAALLMSLLRAGLHAGGLAGEPGAQLERLNDLLLTSTDDVRFATMMLGVLDVGSHRFRYASAGHNPPLLLRGNGRWERLTRGGLPLGMLPDRTYEEEEVALAPGDLLLLYTDGVTEASRATAVGGTAPAVGDTAAAAAAPGGEDAREEFGERRLTELAGRHRDRPARELTDLLLREVLAFCGREHPEDDVTLITVRIN